MSLGLALSLELRSRSDRGGTEQYLVVYIPSEMTYRKRTLGSAPSMLGTSWAHLESSYHSRYTEESGHRLLSLRRVDHRQRKYQVV